MMTKASPPDFVQKALLWAAIAAVIAMLAVAVIAF